LLAERRLLPRGRLDRLLDDANHSFMRSPVSFAKSFALIFWPVPKRPRLINNFELLELSKEAVLRLRRIGKGSSVVAARPCLFL